jgi:hypothetical protein
MRARDAAVAFALPVDGAVPAGSGGILDPQFDAGLELSITKALDQNRSIALRYTGFYSQVSDTVTTAAPLGLSKQLVHPGELNAAATVPRAFGELQIDFHLLDLDYRFVVLSTERTAVNMLIGARYGHLAQDLRAQYENGGLIENVISDVRFHGLGARLGFDLEHHHCNGIFVYGRTAASFLAGEWKADYLHSSNVDPVRATTGWDAGRMTTILDLELGAGLQCGEQCRISAGYQFSGWLNAIGTDDWIDAVRASNRDLAGDNLTFDGFVARLEYRF